MLFESTSSRTVCVCGVDAWSRGDRSHRASLADIGHVVLEIWFQCDGGISGRE